MVADAKIYASCIAMPVPWKPEAERERNRRFDFKQHFWKSLAAIVAGNAIYFLVLVPHLPPAAAHEPRRIDLGLVIDFWVCLACYGIIQVILSFLGRHRRTG